VYVVSCVVSGALALGQAQQARWDGVTVSWGRWAMIAATNPAVVLVVLLSVSIQPIDWWLGGLAAVAASLFLLFGAITPSKDGDNARAALGLWVAFGVMADIAVGALLAGIALGFKSLMPFPHPNAERVKQGNANVFGMPGLLGFTAMTFACITTYTILLAVGPDGFRVYTSEWRELWVLMAFIELVTKYLFLPVVFLVFNEDGGFDVAETAGRVMSPVSPPQSVKSEMATAAAPAYRLLP